MYDLGAFKIKPIETTHDVSNTSYMIDFKPETIYYATDTRELPSEECLKGLSMYFIEANYDEELLEQHIRELNTNGDTENKLYYLNRVKQTHLSSQQATNFLLNNMNENSQYIFLHKSSYNTKEEEIK